MVKSVVFSDFDGTITCEDSNDYIADRYGMGKEKRLEIFKSIIAGTGSFAVGFREMLESIDKPFDECVQILHDNITLDPGFTKTFQYCEKNDIPLIIISSGMKPIIRSLLGKLIGEEKANKIPIMSNDVKIDPKDNSKWEIVYKDTTPHGHDKSISINECKSEFDKKYPNEKITYFYCGDGVSDLSAAKECDLLFAKKGKDLVTFCERDHVPYHEFETWEDILKAMKDVLENGVGVGALMQNK
ncbi:hypothetical protein ACO0RG_004695 [Hanseniaspora osmophila]|uniref:Putative phosphatase n=1 Tax=Hanseniaspora osmophila TaxID=56408 RepID=A0A1E5RZQ6_9ASCO|nr:putative phosphatase [Hanseniaspora osmophila]